MIKFTAQNFKNLGKAIILIFIFAIAFNTLTSAFSPDNELSKSRIAKLKTIDKNSLDTVFIGNSHIYQSVVPQIIDYKLNTTSFVNASAGADFQMSYEKLKNTLKRQKPKCIVLDIFNFKDSVDAVFVHAQTDLSPFSYDNIKIINSHTEKSKRLEFFFPLYTSHLRWKENDFISKTIETIKTNNNPNFFGEFQLTGHINKDFEPIAPLDITQGENFGFATNQEEYFDKFVTLCNKNNIKLLLVVIPFVEQGKTNNDVEKLVTQIENKQLIKDSNVKILDFNKIYDKLDLTSSDMSNHGHLNEFSAAKLSNYLADYLQKENYVEVKNISEEEKKIKEENYNAIMQKYYDDLHLRNGFFTLDDAGITSLNNTGKRGEFISSTKQGELIRSAKFQLKKGECLLHCNIEVKDFYSFNLGKIEIFSGNEENIIYSGDMLNVDIKENVYMNSVIFMVEKDVEDAVLKITNTEGSVIALNDVSVGVMPKDPASYVYN